MRKYPILTFSSCSNVHVSRLAPGSIPLVGSSSITISDPPISAIASDSLRFWPPEKFDASVIRYSGASGNDSYTNKKHKLARKGGGSRIFLASSLSRANISVASLGSKPRPFKKSDNMLNNE